MCIWFNPYFKSVFFANGPPIYTTHFLFLLSYDVDEYGNLDFTEVPTQTADKKNSVSKNKNFFRRRSTKKTKQKKKDNYQKDPIRTTLDHFSYFDADFSDANVDNNEVVYGLDYPKTGVSYNYREGIRNRPASSDHRENYPVSTGTKYLFWL